MSPSSSGSQAYPGAVQHFQTCFRYEPFDQFVRKSRTVANTAELHRLPRWPPSRSRGIRILGRTNLSKAAPSSGLLPCQLADADLWFAEDPSRLQRAQRLCRSCPIQTQCLTGALQDGSPGESGAARSSNTAPSWSIKDAGAGHARSTLVPVTDRGSWRSLAVSWVTAPHISKRSNCNQAPEGTLMRFSNPVTAICLTCGQPTVVAETSIGSLSVHCGTWHWQCHMPATDPPHTDPTRVGPASDRKLAA